MRYTRRQLRALFSLLVYRDQEYSFLQLVTLNWKYFAWTIGFYGGFAIFFYRDHSPSFSAAFAGSLISLLSVNLRRLYTHNTQWKIYNEVIDWTKVKMLIDEQTGKAV